MTGSVFNADLSRLLTLPIIVDGQQGPLNHCNCTVILCAAQMMAASVRYLRHIDDQVAGCHMLWKLSDCEALKKFLDFKFVKQGQSSSDRLSSLSRRVGGRARRGLGHTPAAGLLLRKVR